MKNIYLLLITVFCLFVSCSRNGIYQKRGILTGADLTLCACCGGVLLKADNINYRVDSLPGMSAQQLYNLNFPRTIDFNYQPVAKCQGLNYIEITGFQLLP